MLSYFEKYLSIHWSIKEKKKVDKHRQPGNSKQRWNYTKIKILDRKMETYISVNHGLLIMSLQENSPNVLPL